MAAARGPAFTTAMGVIDRVHHDAANGEGRLPYVTAADRPCRGSGSSCRGSTPRPRWPCIPGAPCGVRRSSEPDLGIAPVPAHELGVGAGGTGDLTALAGLQLDVVNDCPDGHAR